MINMNEYSNPIVATIISVFRSWILSKTNHAAASITSPATSRNKTTSALNIETPVCVHIVLNQTAGGDGTIPSSAKFACPDMRARTDKIVEAPNASGVRGIGRGRSHGEPPFLLCGLSWTEIRLHCGPSDAARPKRLAGSARASDQQPSGRRGLPSPPNLSI
jgi:hypothetical protein